MSQGGLRPIPAHIAGYSIEDVSLSKRQTTVHAQFHTYKQFKITSQPKMYGPPNMSAKWPLMYQNHLILSLWDSSVQISCLHYHNTIKGQLDRWYVYHVYHRYHADTCKSQLNPAFPLQRFAGQILPDDLLFSLHSEFQFRPCGRMLVVQRCRTHQQQNSFVQAAITQMNKV